MFPTRFTTGPSSAMRKPRESKPSMLPKPWRGGSTERASMEARRPSAPHRSSSAEPARATLAASRLSREASASKLPLNRRSRSQQPDPRYGQSSVTPLRSSQYLRVTTTPVRTPSEDRQNRSWQASVERALAFVTIKDQRPISTVAWQRAEIARVQEALSAHGGGGGAGAGAGTLALIRPLTIARFVDITGGLLAALMRDTKLNNDNYVTKLPHLAKRFLYPGTVSKSWLKTVNTLHAFPHALAFIAFFLDLVKHIEKPVSDEWLYRDKDELASLRRDYLCQCWIRFQDPDYDFEDLNQAYLQQLQLLLGDDEQKIAQLKEVISKCEANLEDESELAARALEERRRARRDALTGALRAVRLQRRAAAAARADRLARRADQAAALHALDADIASATAEIQQLKKELEEQTLCAAERARLLDEIEYAARVVDSKRALAGQLGQMVVQKEAELSAWQVRALDACVTYKQGLIHLAAHCPALAALAVDEKELMEAECAAALGRAVDTLRAHAAALAGQRAEHARSRHALARHHTQQLEDTCAKVSELKARLSREQQALEAEGAREGEEAGAWRARRQALARQLDALAASREAHAGAQADLDFWEKQDHAWRTKLSELNEYIEELREERQRTLEAEKRRRAQCVNVAVRAWHERLDDVEHRERRAEAGGRTEHKPGDKQAA